MWWKKNKWKVIVSALIVAVLVSAFYFGGNAPGSRGWEVEDSMTTEILAPEISTNTQAPKPAGDALSSPDKTSGVNATPAPEDVSAEPSGLESTDEPTMEIVSETDKDKYQTDPVPEGKPVPVEPQDVTIGGSAYTCTLSINCAAILNNMDRCNPDKAELVPADGWILEPVTVTFYEGESVFNVLQRTCKQQKIHMEYEDTPIYNSAYIEGIQNLYEYDVGELSGWMYQVNGWFPNYGCSRYQLKNGDVVNWVYTCDLGVDVGSNYATGGNVRGE